MPQDDPDQLASGHRRSIDDARLRPEVTLLGGGGGVRETAAKASTIFSFGPSYPNTAMRFEAREASTRGNGIVVRLRDGSPPAPAPNQALAVSVQDFATNTRWIDVDLATDGAGVIVSTAAQVLAAIQADPTADGLVASGNAPGSDGSGVLPFRVDDQLRGGRDERIVTSTSARGCMVGLLDGNVELQSNDIPWSNVFYDTDGFCENFPAGWPVVPPGLGGLYLLDPVVYIDDPPPGSNLWGLVVERSDSCDFHFTHRAPDGASWIGGRPFVRMLEEGQEVNVSLNGGPVTVQEAWDYTTLVLARIGDLPATWPPSIIGSPG